MKIPLRFQNTEYDCGTTSFVNALAYLYEREELPVELLKAIYKYTLDVEGEDGVIGTGGTSRSHAEKLARYFVDYANNNDFNIKCLILNKDKVNIKDMQECLKKNGVIVARCWQGEEHYVIITKMDNNFAYIFDPYYLEDNYYYNDSEVSVIKFQEFTHNRLVKISRLFNENREDFSLLPVQDREIILINR